MNSDLQQILNTYDSLSKEYAEHFSGEHDKKPKDRDLLKKFAKEVKEWQPVWDFGCGTGETARYLQTLGVKISGLDLSEKMLTEARKLNPGLFFQQGNLLDLQLNSNSIAAILSFYALVHFNEEQVKKALDEMFRVLKPGGLLLFTFHVGKETIHLDEFLGKKIDVDFMLFPTSFMNDAVKDAGFINTELIERPPYQDIEYQSRRGYVFARRPG